MYYMTDWLHELYTYVPSLVWCTGDGGEDKLDYWRHGCMPSRRPSVSCHCRFCHCDGGHLSERREHHQPPSRPPPMEAPVTKSIKVNFKVKCILYIVYLHDLLHSLHVSSSLSSNLDVLNPATKMGSLQYLHAQKAQTVLSCTCM